MTWAYSLGLASGVFMGLAVVGAVVADPKAFDTAIRIGFLLVTSALFAIAAGVWR